MAFLGDAFNRESSIIIAVVARLRIRFLTSTPLDISRGSGTYVGMYVLARALEELGHTVDFETPRLLLPVYTAQRLIFNRGLRARPDYDLTVGFDMDGYRIAAGARHVASLKGVIADEGRFESGLTRFTLGVQGRCEGLAAARRARGSDQPVFRRPRAGILRAGAGARGGAGVNRSGGVAQAPGGSERPFARPLQSFIRRAVLPAQACGRVAARGGGPGDAP